MRFSKKTEYALRALMYAARFPEGTSFQIRDLAEKNGIPKKFLELILLELKNAGVLTSRRGVGRDEGNDPEVHTTRRTAVAGGYRAASAGRQLVARQVSMAPPASGTPWAAPGCNTSPAA